MRRAISLILFCGIILVAFACRSDRFVNPPPSLDGQYVGYISYKYTGQVEQVQPITWVFSSPGFRMKLDTSQVADREFCDCSGSYDTETGLVLTITNPNTGAHLCNEDRNPEGFFTVIQPQIRPDVDDPPANAADSALLEAWDDTLYLIQGLEGGTGTGTIKLVRDLGDN